MVAIREQLRQHPRWRLRLPSLSRPRLGLLRHVPFACFLSIRQVPPSFLRRVRPRQHLLLLQPRHRPRLHKCRMPEHTLERSSVAQTLLRIGSEDRSLSRRPRHLRRASRKHRSRLPRRAFRYRQRSLAHCRFRHSAKRLGHRSAVGLAMRNSLISSARRWREALPLLPRLRLERSHK